MAEALKIRLAARCEAAGRPENEDNFQVAEDLSISNTGFTTDKVFSLGSKGTLLLVCDGMGGMNAGEVASAVGVETIKNLFAPQLLTEDVLANDESVCMYMKRAIVKADSQIKEEASKDEAKQGMGSTAVMAWLLGHKVYVAWCGDSRCYRYNPATGLEQLSHDHSYVQDLVDTGQLSADLAFDHPNKNIITRSLGDPRGAAKPDARVYNLQKGDVILLCSDGLSDSLRDSEIEQSISRSLDSIGACRDSLWNDSKQAGWHDNVTVVLAQVIDENASQPKPQPTPAPKQQPKVDSVVQSSDESAREPDVHKGPSPSTLKVASTQSGKRNKIISIIAVVLVLLCGGGLAWHFLGDNSKNEDKAKYEQLCKDINNPNFNVPDTENAVKKVTNQYRELVELEKSLKIKDHKSENIKKNINEAIKTKQINLRISGLSQDAELADSLEKYKIQ